MKCYDRTVIANPACGVLVVTAYQMYFKYGVPAKVSKTNTAMLLSNIPKPSLTPIGFSLFSGVTVACVKID